MTNMTDNASADSLEVDAAADAIPTHVVDALVPPPASRWRRFLAWGLFAAAVVAGVWFWSTGAVNPDIESRAARWGGEGPVHLGFRIESRSSTDIDITAGLEVPDGLALIGYTTTPFSEELDVAGASGDPFPVRIEADGAVELTALFEVTDCDALRGRTDVAAVTVALANGPFSWFEVRRTIAVDLFIDDQGTPQGWPPAIAAGVCAAPS